LRRARGFFRFTRATFIAARDSFAKLWKVSCEIDNRTAADIRPKRTITGPAVAPYLILK
jgi:hypothetical protein